MEKQTSWGFPNCLQVQTFASRHYSCTDGVCFSASSVRLAERQRVALKAVTAGRFCWILTRLRAGILPLGASTLTGFNSDWRSARGRHPAVSFKSEVWRTNLAFCSVQLGGQGKAVAQRAVFRLSTCFLVNKPNRSYCNVVRREYYIPDWLRLPLTRHSLLPLILQSWGEKNSSTRAIQIAELAQFPAWLLIH